MEKFGTRHLSNVNVHLPLIGMKKDVFFVSMVRFGIVLLNLASVVKELNGMDNFVLFFKAAMEV